LFYKPHALSGVLWFETGLFGGVQPRRNEMPSEDNPNDRFGIPDQLIIDVMRAHRGLIRDGCYVPTRQEVANWTTERLHWHILGWWHESPSELIPSDEQVAAVVAVLRARPDAESKEIQDIIAQAPPPKSGD
jgi:hypothetical protein